MPRSKEVSLGGKVYAIEQLPMRPNKEWRDSLGAPVVQLINAVQHGGNFIAKTDEGDYEIKTEQIMTLIHLAKELLLGSMDLLLDALFRYSPALAADRERIENESYDDEAILALGACVALAYPLDMALAGLMGSGLPVTPISTNSHSQNGDSGMRLPSTGPRKRTSKT